MKCISYLWISDNNANISLVPDYFLLYLFVLLNWTGMVLIFSNVFGTNEIGQLIVENQINVQYYFSIQWVE